MYKDDYAIVSGTISLSNGSGSSTLNYPSGFNSSNCVPVAAGIDVYAQNVFSYFSVASSIIETRLTSSGIIVHLNSTDGIGSSNIKNVRVVLMKI